MRAGSLLRFRSATLFVSPGLEELELQDDRSRTGKNGEEAAKEEQLMGQEARDEKNKRLLKQEHAKRIQ